ncbi:MAG: InlB B-repeat-containing protein [Bacilli bacterium]|nr:InlB B-repeat-containing protein [Bacilli bacterium]
MKKTILMIIPLATISLLASCNEAPKQHTVTFDSDNGTPVASQTVYHGETIYEPTKPTKPSSTEYTFQFDEWQLNGKKYDFNTPVTSDFTLKAKWKENKRTYTVTFDSDGGTKVNPQFIEYSEEARVTNPGRIYRQSDVAYSYTWLGWYEVIDGEMQDEKFNFAETVVDHDILLKVKWDVTINKYTANATNGDHLKFTKDGEPLTNVEIVGNQLFTFEMEAINVTNDTKYIAPSRIQISVGGSPCIYDGYKVDYIKEDKTKARVTIEANKVTGNIEITGEANVAGEYIYDVPFTLGFEEITCEQPVKKEDGDLSLTFVPTDDYALPSAENIYIQFDNCDGDELVQWVSPAETFEKIGEYCSYNEGVLTIKPDHIENHITIIARANDYQLLGELPWSSDDPSTTTINSISSSGLAPYLFYIGEEKTVKVNDLDHQVRIIDFNHDLDVYNNSVGITFEFVNVISDSDGDAEITPWEVKGEDRSTNYNFPHSTLNYLLNYDEYSVLSKIDSGLVSVIKTVNKYVGLDKSYSTEFPYTTQLFPLAHDEITDVPDEEKTPKGEGTLYAYYNHPEETEQEANERRIKKDLNSRAVKYWLRSPSIDNILYTKDSAWYCAEIGNLSSGNISFASNAIAPAFCI